MSSAGYAWVIFVLYIFPDVFLIRSSGPWSEHGTAWYSCNRYDEKTGVDARDAQSKSRASLERYLHVSNLFFLPRLYSNLGSNPSITTDGQTTSNLRNFL
jgi:hypothetical protein